MTQKSSESRTWKIQLPTPIVHIRYRTYLPRSFWVTDQDPVLKVLKRIGFMPWLSGYKKKLHICWQMYITPWVGNWIKSIKLTYDMAIIFSVKIWRRTEIMPSWIRKQVFFPCRKTKIIWKHMFSNQSCESGSWIQLFFTRGSGIRFSRIPDPRIPDPQPIFITAQWPFFG